MMALWFWLINIHLYKYRTIMLIFSLMKKIVFGFIFSFSQILEVTVEKYHSTLIFIKYILIYWLKLLWNRWTLELWEIFDRILPYSKLSNPQNNQHFSKFVRALNKGNAYFLQLFCQKSNRRVVWLLWHCT